MFSSVTAVLFGGGDGVWVCTEALEEEHLCQYFVGEKSKAWKTLGNLHDWRVAETTSERHMRCTGGHSSASEHVARMHKVLGSTQYQQRIRKEDT